MTEDEVEDFYLAVHNRARLRAALDVLRGVILAGKEEKLLVGATKRLYQLNDQLKVRTDAKRRRVSG